MSNGKNIGTGFAEFLGEDGLLEDAQAVAIKRVIAWQLDQLMKVGQRSGAVTIEESSSLCERFGPKVA